MVQQLGFIGYKEALLYEKFGFVFLKEISTYIVYFEEKTYLFVCQQMKPVSSVNQHIISVKATASV